MEKDDAAENDVKHALYKALKANPYDPDLITSSQYETKSHNYISPGAISEAEDYANDARKIWKKHLESLTWLSSQKFQTGYVPSEPNLIQLLQSGKTFLMKCTLIPT